MQKKKKYKHACLIKEPKIVIQALILTFIVKFKNPSKCVVSVEPK